MGAWTKDSKSHVAHMKDGDFYSAEQSVTMDKNTDVKIEFVSESGETKTLKEKVSLLEGEMVDSSRRCQGPLPVL